MVDQGHMSHTRNFIFLISLFIYSNNSNKNIIIKSKQAYVHRERKVIHYIIKKVQGAICFPNPLTSLLPKEKNYFAEYFMRSIHTEFKTPHHLLLPHHHGRFLMEDYSMFSLNNPR